VTRDGRLRRLDHGLVLSSAAIAVASAMWFALRHLGAYEGPSAGWLFTISGQVVAALACWHCATTPGADPVVRRFWRRISLTLLLITFGIVADTSAAIGASAPGPSRGVGMAFHLSGLATLIWAIVALPAGRRSRHSWLTFGLDAGTVIIATSMYVWHFSLRQMVSGPQAQRWSLVILSVFAIIGMIAMIRVSLAWSGPVDHTALRLLGCAVLAGVAVSALEQRVLDVSDPTNFRLAGPLACFLGVCAALRQRRFATRPHRPHRAARRPISLLPYCAVAAVGALLVIEVPAGSLEDRVIVYGAVLLTGLVLVRQAADFYDNSRLLRQVDAGTAELRSHERRFRSLVQQAADIILITGVDGRISYTSPALRRVLGLTEEELPQRSIRSLIHPDDLPLVQRHVAQVAAVPSGVATFRARVEHADGTWRCLEIVSSNLLGDPSVRGIVSNARDITDTLRYQEQLAYQATHDELTRLPNRSLLLERARDALAAPDAGQVGIALIDLDDFKVINDRLGHQIGDALLVAVGQVLAASVGPADIVARLGGDEFAVLLTAATPEATTATLERIIAALDAPLHADGYDLLVQASTGLAHGAAGDDAAELLRRADVALYAAKDRGKARYASYEPALDVRSAENAQIGAELRQAIDAGDQLHLLYQPIVTLPDGHISGVEALVRWKHPQRGPVSPGEFIPIAERTGLIVPLGRWILREACWQAVAWMADPETVPITVSVNVSARQLREPGFPDDVAAVLCETGIDARSLTIEVTETAVFDSGPALEALRQISDLGVRVALDDFGTGHSSLGLLRSCPVDVLKVDKSFIDGVTGTVEQAAIAISLIQITTTMGLGTVAEGVETQEQADTLHKLGYRLAQGFYFARPAPPEQIHQLLRADGRTRTAALTGAA